MKPRSTLVRRLFPDPQRCRYAWTALGVLTALVLYGAPEPLQAQAVLADSALQEARERARIPPGSDIDLAHGRDVMMGTGICPTGRCVSCYQCHGVRGEGSALLAIPRLAGQPYRYLFNSLRNFATGQRENVIMSPIARALSPAAWRDVAAFYSAQRPVLPDMATFAQHKGQSEPERLAQGAMIANIGIAERGVQACVNCHGPQGAGMPPTFPYLASQYAEYLQGRLRSWQKAAPDRAEDYGFAIMREIAQRLTDDDIVAVSQYFAAIRPPRVVRDENYAGPLLLGVPLGPQRGLRGAPLPEGVP